MVQRLPFLCIALLMPMLAGCYEVERNCENFKTGTFTFEAMVGTELLTTTFIRNDSIEIDYFQGKSDTSNIRWINDCEYVVKKQKPSKMAEEKAIHMKILTTDGNSYKFEYSVVGEDRKERGMARKVSDSLIAPY